MRKIPLNECTLAFTDSETTGLDTTTHEMVEIYLALADFQGNILSEHQWYMHPRWPGIAQQEALNLNGYTPEKWEALGTVSHERAIREYSDLCRSSLFTSWNVVYDWNMVETELRRHGLQWMGHYHRIDVAVLAWPAVVRGGLKSMSQVKVGEYLGIPNLAPHTGRGDVRQMAQLYKHLLQSYAS